MYLFGAGICCCCEFVVVVVSCMVAATAARGYIGEAAEELLLLLDDSMVDILWMQTLSIEDEHGNKENTGLTRFVATHRPTIRLLAIQDVCFYGMFEIRKSKRWRRSNTDKRWKMDLVRCLTDEG
jgi:hypothetical protein